MKVVIVNTSEKRGGAAVAANRLMRASKKIGLKTTMLVRDKESDDASVTSLTNIARSRRHFLYERFVIWFTNFFHKKNLFAIDIANCGTDISSMQQVEQADIIHLHWINQGMLSLNDIRRIAQAGKPIVWTMHDMWPFTGICHHSDECDRYERQCHNCPLLYRGKRKDLSTAIFDKKKDIYKNADIHFIACSKWIGEKARKSPLLKGKDITVIANPIDTEIFHPADKKAARGKLHLPQEKKLLLFGSVKVNDKRKGIDYMTEACRILQSTAPELCKNIGIVIFGSNTDKISSLFPFPIYSMDYVSNEKDLNDIYNAVDVYVTPSLQENLPNIIMESMACGLPCVGFNVGGVPEMIDHLTTGYVSEYKSAVDLAKGISWVLCESQYDKLGEAAREKAVREYSEEVVARKILRIYENMLLKK